MASHQETLQDQHHTYGLQWDNQYIRMFVDGNKIYEMYIKQCGRY